MANFPHRIRRQRWLVRASSTAAAFTLRQRLRDDWDGVLLPAFKTVFDEEARTEEVLRIPRIELTLKLAAAEEGSASWSRLICDQLLEQLREILRARHDAPEKPRQKRSSAQEDRFRNLLHYLRSGSVSWEAAGVSAAELAIELQKICRERLPELATLLRAKPAPSPAFCFRWLQLLPAAQTAEAVRAILGEPLFPWQTSVLEILMSILVPEQTHLGRYTQLQLAALFLSETLAARLSYTVPDFIRSAGRVLPFASAAVVDFIASFPSLRDVHATKDSTSKAGAAKESGLGTEVLSRTSSSEPSASDEKELCALTDATVPDPVSGARHVRPFEDEGVADARATADSITSLIATIPDVFQKKVPARAFPLTQPSLFKSAAEADFSLLAAHAGLILLHPFLPRFFESTGIKRKDDVDLSASVWPRAAALLHFLATNEDAIYEYDLAFIKVLLAIGLETPLCVAEGLIGEADKREIAMLLQSVIEHWAALKQTSIAALRSYFLQRRGLLRKGENAWKLQIERRPFDVLLEHLPWSISVVKLPWMKYPLYTEW